MKMRNLSTARTHEIGRAVKRPLHILDLFCGAGGTSTGAMEAAAHSGYDPRLTAINHWPVAVETHAKNHPDSRHLCTGIDQVNPRELYDRGELHILWGSPVCTHHSNAAGGMPLNEQLRATAWCMVKFADALLPPVVLIENVPEFRGWGPLKRVRKNGKLIWRPDPARKGETFRAFLCALESLGYKVDHRVLCAADYGDPTTRRRIFVQAQRGARRIVWPNPTHGEGRVPWVPAREIIDWKLPCPSIYRRPRPLSPKTMMRIWEGLQAFGLNASLICMEHKGSVRSVAKPVLTITTAKGGAMAVARPFLIQYRGTSARQLGATAMSVDAPIKTVSAGGRHTALIEPALLPQQSGGRVRPVSEPCPTVAASGAIALVEPYLVKYYGTGKGASIHEPLDTVTAKDRFALCKPMIVEIGKDRYMLDIGFRMLKWPELSLAQGFRGDYDFAGNQKRWMRLPPTQIENSQRVLKSRLGA